MTNLGSSATLPSPPLRATIIPITAFRQNCTLLWCTATGRGAFVDPGGDLGALERAARQHGVDVEKLIVTHGHADHCGQAGILARKLGVPIEGPHEADTFLLDGLDDQAEMFGIVASPFRPDRWLDDGDTVTVGDLVLDVLHCPGHTPGHVIFHHPASALALVGDVLFKGSIGRSDLPGGNHEQLVASITGKLWPLGGQTIFVPGHGETSSFAAERATNPFVADSVTCLA